MYNFFPYFLAKSMVEVPLSLICPLVTLLVVYWGAGFRQTGGEEFLQIYIVLVVLANCAISMGLFCSAIASSLPQASALSSLFTLPVILFGGLFANSSTIPPYLSWIQYISPIRYANEAICQAQWNGVNIDTENFLSLLGFDIGYIKCTIVLAALAVFWRLAALVVLRLKISKFQ